ncbi:protein kinase [Nonomuraea sp. NPDC050478]|uniref:serine/threonine-protein kinase n=1 Tax=Nonomuraea sp. NPDC050478 TaxID=3364365 RepID=UPI0037AC3F68
MGQQGRSAGTPLTPEDPPAIGPYELAGRLGSGGMGTVYLAKGPDGATVALKAIRRDFTADPVYRARFHEEVSNARKVASFCTARVLDHGEHDGVLYLVTEFIDGVSLEDHLIEHGRLSPSMLHSAAVGVAAALTAIHAAGLVHRDLKPANVMLTLAGPRVIDFGLARSTHVSSRHTNAGMVMGTPGWIAPEQVFEGRTSPAGDVFAWGSLIAYAGLGGHPFGEGDAYVMAARARTAPPDLRGLPAPLDRLVAAAIHPDPARRPTAKQLLLELVSATDEPAAQLAASRHLTDSWNPAEFPPLAHRPGAHPHPGPRAPHQGGRAEPHPETSGRFARPEPGAPHQPPPGAPSGPPPADTSGRFPMPAPDASRQPAPAGPAPRPTDAPPPAETPGNFPGAHQAPPAEAPGHFPGSGQGAHQAPPAETSGNVPRPGPGGPHQGPRPTVPPAETSGNFRRSGPGGPYQAPPAETSGNVPRPGPGGPHQGPRPTVPPAETSGNVPRSGGRGPRQGPPGEASGTFQGPRQAAPMPPAETSGRFPRPGRQAPQVPPHQTGQGPLPRRGPLPPGARPAKPGRNLFTGCLAAVVIMLVLLALLVAVLVWMSRGPSAGEAGNPVQDGKLTLTVSDTECAEPPSSGMPPACRVALDRVR